MCANRPYRPSQRALRPSLKSASTRSRDRVRTAVARPPATHSMKGSPRLPTKPALQNSLNTMRLSRMCTALSPCTSCWRGGSHTCHARRGDARTCGASGMHGASTWTHAWGMPGQAHRLMSAPRACGMPVQSHTYHERIRLVGRPLPVGLAVLLRRKGRRGSIVKVKG